MTDPSELARLLKAKADARKSAIAEQRQKIIDAEAARKKEADALGHALKHVALPYLQKVKATLKDNFDFAPINEVRSTNLLGVEFTVVESELSVTISIRKNKTGQLSVNRITHANQTPTGAPFPPNNGEPVIKSSHDLTEEKIGSLIKAMIQALA